MADRMSDEQWMTIRNDRWNTGSVSAIRTELDRARAREEELEALVRKLLTAHDMETPLSYMQAMARDAGIEL